MKRINNVNAISCKRPNRFLPTDWECYFSYSWRGEDRGKTITGIKNLNIDDPDKMIQRFDRDETIIMTTPTARMTCNVEDVSDIQCKVINKGQKHGI